METAIGSAAALIHEEKPPDPILTETPGHTADGYSGDRSLGDEHAGLEAVDLEFLAVRGVGWEAAGEEGGKSGESDAEEEEDGGMKDEGMEREGGEEEGTETEEAEEGLETAQGAIKRSGDCREERNGGVPVAIGCWRRRRASWERGVVDERGKKRRRLGWSGRRRRRRGGRRRRRGRGWGRSCHGSEKLREGLYNCIVWFRL